MAKVMSRIFITNNISRLCGTKQN